MQNPTRILRNLCVPLVVLLLASTSAATCTTWNPTETWIDKPDHYMTAFTQDVDSFFCRGSSDQYCVFPQTTYNVTVDRVLFTGAAPGDPPSGHRVDQGEDADAIWALATKSFYNATFNTTSTIKGYEFVNRTAIISTKVIPSPSPLLNVQPSTNVTRQWIAFMMYSSGIVGGCSDSSLNGLNVTAASSYVNQSTIAGMFSGVIQGENGAGHLGKPYTLWTLAISIASVTVVAFVL
jgi:hypothetical protein